MKYYLVAGEASGDLHGANLMKALKAEDGEAVFRYFGGDKMQAEGGELVKHYADMAFMGFTEVILNLRTIFKNLKACKNDIIQWKPDVLILIDFPGFNLKIAEFAKANGIKVCYYISPKVWAWNQKRVLKIKKVVDHMFCILPFEVDFYKEWGMQVDYVGNPLLDEIAQFTPDLNFRENHQLGDGKIIVLLPGSRKQEIERLLSVMLSVTENHPDYIFAIAAAPTFTESYYRQFTGDKKIHLLFNSTYNLLHHAHAAIVASGTATLETALFKVPQVVIYKGGTISIAIARMLVKIKFISLVNLIVNKKIVTELIQEDCNTQKVNGELEIILTGEGRNEMLKHYDELLLLMGKPGASAKTARLITTYLHKTI
ncbi:MULTISPECIES: lipid-A-disaccharide synthase [unclassified Pedobacter]|uniref:lipid-A-disaccharide synthase n=1 Tax=unclassified Pedobacter TaxID=2628915 RepID=UPI001D6B5FB9|nr:MULTISPECIES: lipid-A-disaccharide synthase [unclassified Pedobacter]CAH0250833.1 Lipid-A-disaccharide synthase [Pedobacter sp. Bi36]CAH0275713.1 Lipid-A-disaccharide synthase [Pedobacter sp. Bi126]